MLINAWDRADDRTWRIWLAERDFGLFAANGPEGAAPVLVPSHFLYEGGDEVLLHLARPNPIWAALEANPRITLAVTDDWSFVPGSWRAPEGARPEEGVPTSYYASVHLVGTATVVDDPDAKAELIGRQLARFQPEVANGPVVPGQPPFGRMLSAIRGLRVSVEEVRPKFKYDGHKDEAHRTRVADRMAERGGPGDAAARARLLP